MKLILGTLVFALSVSASALTVKSTKSMVSPARVTQVIPLVQKENGLQVSILIEDLGGSTDVSPTLRTWLTIYKKGEMFSTDAAFKIADLIQFQSATRLAGGVYEIRGVSIGLPDASISEKVITIDARKAVTELQNVTCNDEFDCDASTNFKSSVEVSVK